MNLTPEQAAFRDRAVQDAKAYGDDTALLLVASLADWKRRPYVLGALAAGSRAMGTDDKYSDIDVQIVMANSIKWRERGLDRSQGYIVEYSANPVRVYKEYYRDGCRGNSKSIARMFAYGRLQYEGLAASDEGRLS